MKGWLLAPALAIDNARLFTDLRASEEAAGAATRAKTVFLANMSHEIRTPMNGVVAAAELLQGTTLDTEQHTLLDIVRSSGNHLIRIIDDILDFSKIESGRLDVLLKPCDLRTCVEQAIDQIAFTLFEKQLDIAYNIAPQTPTLIISDYARLSQILLNLLSNAVKFTDQGGIFVQVSARLLHDRVYEIVFAISDTGIGITAEQQEQLFQTFSQIELPTKRLYGGTGLGLALSRRLCEMLGGSIAVESTPGVGSTFSCTIQAEALPEQPSAIDVPLPQLAGACVMLLAASSPSSTMISTIMRQWGMQVHTSSSLREALTWLETSARCDMILLSVQHAETLAGDSTLVAAALRAPHRAQQLPLMLLTPLSLDGDSLQALRPHVQAILTQPIKLRQLQATLLDLLAPTDATNRLSSVPTQPEPGRSSARILVAEDDPTNQKLIRILLETLGHAVTIVSNGKEALDALAEGSYDVVFLDVQMPELDGIETARAICQTFDPDRRPYLVALTASVINGDRERCFEAGMDDYVSKPFSVETVQGALSRSQQPGGMPVLVPSGGTSRVLPVAAETLPVLDFAVWTSMQAMLGSDAARHWADVLNEYVQDTVVLFERMHAAFACSDLTTLQRTAHQLKGSSAMIGAAQLAAISGEFEQGCTTNCNAMEQQLARLDAAWRRAQAELEKQLANAPTTLVQ